MALYFSAIPVGTALGFVYAGYWSALFNDKWEFTFLCEIPMMFPFVLGCLFAPPHVLERKKKKTKGRKHSIGLSGVEEAEGGLLENVGMEGNFSFFFCFSSICVFVCAVLLLSSYLTFVMVRFIASVVSLFLLEGIFWVVTFSWFSFLSSSSSSVLVCTVCVCVLLLLSIPPLQCVINLSADIYLESFIASETEEEDEDEEDEEAEVVYSLWEAIYGCLSSPVFALTSIGYGFFTAVTAGLAFYVPTFLQDYRPADARWDFTGILFHGFNR